MNINVRTTNITRIVGSIQQQYHQALQFRIHLKKKESMESVLNSATYVASCYGIIQ